jgi:hypothetical protein
MRRGDNAQLARVSFVDDLKSAPVAKPAAAETAKPVKPAAKPKAAAPKKPAAKKSTAKTSPKKEAK